MENNEGGSKGKYIFGLERNIFFAGVTSFLTDISTKMVYSIMPLFLLSIGASKTTLSLIEGVAESAASILKAVSGLWSDKIGKNKPFMLIGYAVTALITPIYAFVASPLQVLYLRFLERVGKGVRTSPRDSLVAGSSKNGKVGKNFGFHRAMDNSGAILGPLIAFLILMVFPGEYRKIFIFAAIPAVLGVVTIALFIREVKKEKSELPEKITFKDFPRRYYKFIFIAFVFTLGDSTDALLLIKANDVGVNVTYIPFVYLIFNFVAVLFSVPFGMLSDKIGREKIIIFGYLVYSITYFGFGLTNSVAVIIMLFALYGLYSAATEGIQRAFVSDLVDDDKKGTGLGIYNFVVGLTLFPASVIAGLLYDKVNSSVPFYFGALMALIAAVLLFVMKKSK